MKQSLTFLHTNDIHSSFEQEVKVARVIRRRRDELQAAGMPVLLVDGGDHVDMSVLECMGTAGQLNLDLHDALGYVAAAVGNNELSRFSKEQIIALSRTSKVPWLLANLREADGSTLGGMCESLLVQAGSIKVGFTGTTDQLDNVYESFMGLKSVDTAATVREIAHDLRGQGADLIVVLSHNGLNQDRELAKQWGGIVDVIIGGHTHDALYEPIVESGVVIVQAGSHGRLLGELQLELDLSAEVGHKIVRFEGQLHPVDADVEPDEEALAIYQQAVQQVEANMSEVLCTLDVPLSHAELVTWLAKAMRHHYEDAELGMMFGAVAVDGLPAGPLRLGDVYQCCRSLVCIAKLGFQGKQLLGLLHERQDPAIYTRRKYGNGLRPKDLPVGRLYFDGLTWEEQDGAITNVRVNGEPLDLERWYIVGGGEHLHYADTLFYPSLEGSKLLHVDDYFYVKDAFVDHLRNLRTKEVLL